MFETAEIGNRIDKASFKREAPKIRSALLDVQRQLAGSSLSVIVHIGGVEGAGKSETVNLLLEWMDARGIQVNAITEPTDEERERPPMWRFWRLLPPKGRIGVFLGSWYSEPIVERAFGRIDDADFEQSLDRIVEFETMLVQEDTLLLKFWMHLSRQAQEKRLKKLERDPKTSWRVTKRDWKFFRRYDRFRSVSENALRKTSTVHAPWHIVEAADPRYRFLTVTNTMLEAMKERLARMGARSRRPTSQSLPKPAKVNIINQLDLRRTVSKKAYENRLLRLQGRLARLTRQLYEQRSSLLLVFEGPDAGGKGGTIRRLTAAIDARLYQVISVAAPTDEESSHPYLWRFWRHMPRLGKVTIYDRSWYGRVLVERVEGFCAPADWQRAFSEITAFEAQLTDFGIILMKFWLAISPEEQLRRFKDRETTPYKQYKITEEDWRNRAKWDAYEAAACDTIEKTSTQAAPWVLVEANSKQYARLKVIGAVCARLEQALDGARPSA